MPFVKRNDRGDIIAVSPTHESGFAEQVEPDDAQLVDFMEGLSVEKPSLDSTDQDFIRVLEDVVELLISKGVILFTELPESAQEKMMHRQRLRSEMSDRLDLIGSD